MSDDPKDGIGPKQEAVLKMLNTCNEWRAGMWPNDVAPDAVADRPSLANCNNGQIDQLFASMEERGYCERVGENEHGVGIWRATEAGRKRLS